MRKIVWLDKAADDVARLREFIAPHNKDAAKRAARTILDGSKILQYYPYIAHPVEDLPDFHELIIPFGAGSYILRYRIEAETVYIVGVRHSREAGDKD